MTVKVIKYRAGFKYQLAEPYVGKVAELTSEHIAHSDFIVLSTAGDLIINAGYSWNGCSGPAWDDQSNMRGGLVHDALYQLMREGLLPVSCRELADKELQKICIEDGMNPIRSWMYFKFVRIFGDPYAVSGSNPFPVITAPV